MNRQIYKIRDFNETEFKLLLINFNIEGDILEKLDCLRGCDMNFIYWDDLIEVMEIEKARKVWTILNAKYYQKPQLKYTFYKQGDYFQMNKREKTPFEERYAIRTFVKSFLYCSKRMSYENQINVCSDITSYILTFLLPREMGKVIEVKKLNYQILMPQNFNKILENQCQYGHKYNGPCTCKHCNRLRYRYEEIKLQLELMNDERLIYIEDYIVRRDLREDLQQNKLNYEIQAMKVDYKMFKLTEKHIKKYKIFQSC
jgi:hypothetical protein